MSSDALGLLGSREEESAESASSSEAGPAPSTMPLSSLTETVVTPRSPAAPDAYAGPGNGSRTSQTPGLCTEITCVEHTPDVKETEERPEEYSNP